MKYIGGNVVRFFVVLIGLYNFFLLSRVWAVAIGNLIRPLINFVPNSLMVIALIFGVFFIIQSISLILLRITSIKIQIIIFCIDPLLRLYSMVTIYSLYPEKNFSVPLIAIGFVIFMAIDIFAIFFLKSKSVKRLATYIEEQRNIKLHEKLMKKNMSKIS
jgi:hypothetical protein